MRDESARILVVDDEPAVVDFLTRTLRHTARRVKACFDADSAIEYARKEKPDLLVADFGLPGMDGVALSHVLKEADPELELILITGDDPHWKAGLVPSEWDWVAKPFQGQRLRWVAEHALERHRLRRENRFLAAELTWVPPEVLTGARSPSIQAAMKRAMGFAKNSEPLLWVSGETGVGKRSLARWIHEYSDYAARPMLVLPASDAKVERLEQMFEGTLVVTHAESLPLAFGMALLKRLEENATLKSRSDLKIILESETDPFGWNRSQRPMEGLYRIMQANHIHLPPLRQRVEDLFPLITFYLREWSNQAGLPVPKMELSALRLLENHPWIENAREVRQVMHEVLANKTLEIRGADLHEVLKRHSSAILELGSNTPHRLEDVERQVLLCTLKAKEGDKVATAKELGISLRTLYRKLRDLQSSAFPESLPEVDAGGIKVEGESGDISG